MQPIQFDESKDLELRAPLMAAGTDYSLDIVSAGSGLSQILMLAAVLAWRQPGLVLLDEPDAHLHSSVQAQLLDFLGDLSESYNIQIIAATHSRDLIARAPLEAIVPVDSSRPEVSPLKSLEHLLLEFERHGAVSNVDLALLYQSRRCVFVEGQTEVDLLPRIAQRLGYTLFQGNNQVVPFDIKGVGKVGLIPELVRLFERLVGAPLSYGVVRDNDAHIPEVRSALKRQAEDLGFPVFHMWTRYCLENYLIEPELLLIAIKRLDPETRITPTLIGEYLDEAIADVADDINGLFIMTAQTAFREILSSDDWVKAGASAAARHIKSLDARERFLVAYPGRRIFGKFVQRLQEKHGIHLRMEHVLSVLTKENVPAEVLECFDKLERIG
jgi:predicted ATP-dependent endonuclease of OLD family